MDWIMNFLINGNLPRYYHLSIWRRTRHDFLKLSCVIPSKNHQKLNIDNINGLVNVTQSNYLQNRTNWFSLTQVRYKNEKHDYPRLHGDMDYPNFDYYRKKQYQNVNKTTYGVGDEKPGITYIISFFGLMTATYGLKSEVTRFVSYMAASADVLAMSTVEVDIAKIRPGACISLKWRGKPLFVKNRTPSEIDAEALTPLSALKDPETPEQRCQKQEWLIVIGICTHLGCVPIANLGDWPGGFYCPCHGSHYDNVGRARKGPAPLNLEVPPYKFTSDNIVLVG